MRRGRAFAVAALLGLAGAQAVRADGASSTELVRALGGEDALARGEAYAALLTRRPPDALPLLAKAVPGMPLVGQQFGFAILQGYPPADTKPVFERWTSSGGPFLRVAAGATLLRAGEAKVAPTVVKALATPALEPGLLATMLIHLYGVKDAQVLAAVRGLLRPDAPTEVLSAALYQLLGAMDESAKQAVTPLLDAPSVGIRAIAAAYLLDLGDEEMAARLAMALASGEVAYVEFVRVHGILARMPRCPEPVLDALVTLLAAEPKGYALPLVIGLLGQFAHAKAVPVLKALLERDEALVSKAAFEALSRIPGALTPDVTRALLGSKDESRRVAAAEALLRTDDLSGLPAVVAVLRSGKTARADAARALGTFRSRAAVEPLIDALLDADLSVRANAYNGLAVLLGTLFPYRRIDLAGTGYTTTGAAEVRAAAAERCASPVRPANAWIVAVKTVRSTRGSTSARSRPSSTPSRIARWMTLRDRPMAPRNLRTAGSERAA